eukprot:TRINITY_DN4045_c2_g1_i1.p1 TRINITY_DN4045_c2_g1~~TRINITY_DN4045_c2_g1_i1.p1  ORF type:complete len:3152 (+),score=913.67 TRINITY_DN4045_c2_g1_i1:65-9520(+)
MRAAVGVLAAVWLSAGQTDPPVDVNRQEGVEVWYNWSSWPKGDAFEGHDQDCASRAPAYVDCRFQLDEPPRVTMHSMVESRSIADGDSVLMVFGGRRSRYNPLIAGTAVTDELYGYHVPTSLWWRIGGNSTADAAVAWPPARQAHVAWTASLSPDAAVTCNNERDDDIKDCTPCGDECRMLMYGGYGSDGRPLGDVWEFFNGTWAQLTADAGPELAGHSVVWDAARNVALIFGGYGIDGTLQNDLWEFNMTSMNWTLVEPTGTKPTPRAHHAAVLLPSRPTSPPPDHSGVWSQAAGLDVMIVIGGQQQDGVDVAPTKEVWGFKPSLGYWQRLAGTPNGYFSRATQQLVPPFSTQERSRHSCWRVGQRAVCVGGWTTGLFEDVVEYDAEFDRLSVPRLQTRPPTKLHGAAAVFSATRGVSWILGGTSGGPTSLLPQTVFHASYRIPDQCAAGWFSPDGDWRCYPCPAGWASRLYSCDMCVAGYYTSASLRSCDPCPAGHYTFANASANVTDCIPCPSGTRLPAGAGSSLRACELCPSGTYNNLTGQKECNACPAGTKGTGIGSTSPWDGCDPCTYGTYSPQGASSCTACPAGTQSAALAPRLKPFSLQIVNWGLSADSCGARCPRVACSASCHRSSDSSSQCDSNYAIPCTSGCPTLICGSCGAQYGGTVADYTVYAGEPVYFQVQIYDSGGLPHTQKGVAYLSGASCTTSPYAPCRQLYLQGEQNFDNRASTAVTVEKINGDGSLHHGCTAAYPASCTGTLANGVAGDDGAASAASTNVCYANRRQSSSANKPWFFYGLRFDTATPETTLVFRSEGLLAARITLRVEGITFAITEHPPNYTVATEPFAVSVMVGDPLGNADVTATSAIAIAAPSCVQVVDGVAQSTTIPASMSIGGSAYSTSAYSNQGPVAGGRYTFSIAVSGPTATASAGLAAVAGATDKGTMLLCSITFTASVTGFPTAETYQFYVQQPYALYVRHDVHSFAGQPISMHVEVHDPDGEVVRGDNKTSLSVSLISAFAPLPTAYWDPNVTSFFGPNASLRTVSGSGLVKTAAQGEADFYMLLTDPADAKIRVDASHVYGSIPIIPNSTVFVTASAANTTRLGIADANRDPALTPFPTEVMANQTFWVGVRAENDYGDLDATASFLVAATLTCDGPAELSAVNTTELHRVARLVAGRANIGFSVQSEGAASCRLGFQHVSSDSDPPSIRLNRPRSYTSPSFAVVNPHTVLVEWNITTCTIADSCPSANCRISVAQWVEVNATIQTQGGTTMTALQNVFVNMSSSLAREAVEMEPAGFEYGSMAPVVNGMAQFRFRIVEHVYGSIQFTFTAGTENVIIDYNETFVLVGASGDVQSISTETGRQSVLEPWHFMDSTNPCSFVVAILATQLRIVEDPMVWIQSGRTVTLTMQGVDELGNVDTALSGTAALSVVNCEGGLPTHPAFSLVSGSTSTLFTASTALVTITNGQGTFTFKGTMAYMHWEHSPAYKTSRGAYGCTLRMSMSPVPTGYTAMSGEWDPFELMILSEQCQACALGYWSPGGDGTAEYAYHLQLASSGTDPYTVYPYPANDAILASPSRAIGTGRWGENWPGGCTPCMTGTYSTEDRASTLDSCKVCPPGSGYESSPGDARAWVAASFRPEREGLSSCVSCSHGSLSSGKVGGGSCSTITEVVSNINPSGGLTGMYCTNAECGGCAQGKYALVCSDYTASGQTVCETSSQTNGSCSWVNSACTFTNNDESPRKCVDCPAGTFQSNNGNSLGISSCTNCAAGSYSTQPGHGIMAFGDRDPRGCYQDRQQLCIGANSGQCPNGTYGVVGAANASQCVTCPRGRWSRQQFLTLGNTLCGATGSGYPTPVGTCTLKTGVADYQCPFGSSYSCCNPCRISSYTAGGSCSGASSYTVMEPVGAAFCFKCKPGTYSVAEGGTSVEACLDCPSGYYCAAGAPYPLPADYDSFTLHSVLVAMSAGASVTAEERELLDKYPGATLGQIRTRAYSLNNATEPIPCDMEEVNDCPPGAVPTTAVTGRNCYPTLRDAEGLIADGHFSMYMWKESYPNEFGRDGGEGYDDSWNVLSVEDGSVALDTSVDHTSPLNAMVQTCASAGGYAASGNYGVTGSDGQTGVYYCCASVCDTSTGGPGCGGTTACASAVHNASCCRDTILAARKTCGPVNGAPCVIPGPGSTNSGSLRLNASVSETSVSQVITIGMLNSGLDLYGSVWGRNDISRSLSEAISVAAPPTATLTIPNGTNETEHVEEDGQVVYGVRFEVFLDHEWLANNTPLASFEAIPTNTLITDPIRTSSNTDQWALGEVSIVANSAAKYIRVTPFVRGAYLGNVYIDDVSLRVHPAQACNCSLGYFFNASRLGDSGYSTPCQRCEGGHFCSGGVISQCPEKGYTQGGAYQCQTCPNGWLCDYNGRGGSTPCPEYTYEDESSTLDKCRTCPLGYACKDGVRTACNYGAYGDGSKHCHLCLPGYYANATTGPVIECLRCEPGSESNYMRTECVLCPANKYSWNGTRCVNCPPYTFTRSSGSYKCESCLNDVLPPVTVNMVRNQIQSGIRMLPEKCVPGREWRIDGVTHSGTALGEVSWENPPEVDAVGATYVLTQDTMGTDTMVFIVTPGHGEPLQSVEVSVVVSNVAPQAYDDNITVTHTFGSEVTLELTTLLENDVDPNNDHLYIHSWAWDRAWGHYGIADASISIDSTRKKITLTLPKWFTGPMNKLKYKVMDQNVDNCTAPACLTSTGDTEWGVVTITAKGAPPTAVQDNYTITPSGRVMLDVLANDTNSDNDPLSLTVGRGQLYNGQQVVPVVREVCPAADGGAGSSAPSCPTSDCGVGNQETFPSGSSSTWYGVVDLGQTTCSCTANTTSGLCDIIAFKVENSVATTISVPKYYIEYPALSGFCGTDYFDYSVKGNEDSASTGRVYMTVSQCVCSGSSTSPGIDVFFVLDGTNAEVGSQWADMKVFAQSLQERFTFGNPTHGVRVALLQYAGAGTTAGITIHRGLDESDGSSLVAYTTFSLVEKMGNAAQTAATLDCPQPPCSDLGPAMKEAAAQLVAASTTGVANADTRRKILAVIHDHPFGDPGEVARESSTLATQASSYSNAPPQVYFFSVGAAAAEAAAALSLTTATVSKYSFNDHASLLSNSALFSTIVDHMCQAP